ncbi:MAG: nuclear transport factor 2 family protein [Saprospiraceae bacterium]
MRNNRLSFWMLSLLFFACGKTAKGPSLEALKAEVMQAEAAFAKMAREEGLENAFVHFAAAEAVINRNDKLYKGKTAIKAYFQNNQRYTDVKLDWKPDFISVAASGDMAYTYGPYTYEAMDSLKKIEATGIFHTVWQRQADGTWKYVWD